MTGPFAGLKVLELGRFIAVPFCGQVLAEGGADVIKIEDLDGDQSRHNGPILPFEGRQYLNKNRGKRSVSVELTDPEVLPAVQRLAASADVILANFRPGLSARLGLDYESVQRHNPRVIYAENTAYGLRGPMAHMAGMDIVLQGLTGIAMTERGPEQIKNPIIDYTAAMLMAFGVSTALYHRERTGRGQRLDVALMHAAMLLQNNQLTHVDLIDGWRDEFVDYLKQAFARGSTWTEVLEHRDQLEPHALVRAYYGFFETADGAVAIACNARTLRLGMIEVMGFEDRWTTERGWLPDDARAYERELRDDVCRRFRAAPTGHWLAEFGKRGLPIGPVRHSDELFGDEQVAANGFLDGFDHEVLGRVTVVAPGVRFSDSPLEIGAAVPLGRHTREVLEEAGLSAAEISGLFARGAVREVDESLADLL